MMNMTDDTGIYAIENVLVPRAYVGATKQSFARRWYAHLIYLHRGFHFNPALSQDVQRYGTCAFRLVVLQRLPPSATYAVFEQFWIDYLTQHGVRCYNVIPAYETMLPNLDASDVPPDYGYTMADVRRRLKIADGTVYGKIKTQVIRPIRSRTRWHFSEENIQQLRRDQAFHRAVRRRQLRPPDEPLC